MKPLEIYTFGVFEIHASGRRVEHFESRKVEALAAYLVAHPRRSFSRDHLAGLLWPERPDSSARRNLRQALYNLRSAVDSDGGAPRIVGDGRSLRFELRAEDSLDLDRFQRLLTPAEGKTAVDPADLARGTRLYRGDFLEGIDAPGTAFQEWLLAAQERHREAVVRALRQLASHALAAGAYHEGIRHAHHLVRIDPLAEEAHRLLIELFARSGRRGRAVAQFRELEEVLDRELGVEPLEATTELYRRLRNGEMPAVERAVTPETVGPLLPMVGRSEAVRALEDRWREVLGGRSGLTLVEAEEGVGKSRLVKTFLHRVTSAGDRATILKGSWSELEPTLPYRGVHEALDQLVIHELDALERVLQALEAEDLGRLAHLVPRLASAAKPTALRALRRPGERTPLVRRDLAGALGRTLRAIAREEPDPAEAVVLFLEDLHWADRSSLKLLPELVACLGSDDAGAPVWIVATVRPGRVSSRLQTALPEAGVLPLEPLTGGDLRELAEALVGPGLARALARLLEERTGGNALHASTVIDLLWDEGALVPAGEGWTLATELQGALPSGGIEELVLARVARLPPSARRLLTLASVVGVRFEPGMLGEVEGEERAVIEAALHKLLERWLLRPSLGYWADSRRDRDLAAWARGNRFATFEFVHGAVRRAVYRALDPERRRALHLKVARALERRPGSAEGPAPEVLAHHYLEGGDGDRAACWLAEASNRADRLAAPSEAEHARKLAARASARE